MAQKEVKDGVGDDRSNKNQHQDIGVLNNVNQEEQKLSAGSIIV